MATANVKPSYQITPPEPFNFSAPKEWPKWIRRFERFRHASQLSKSDQESQVSTLIYQGCQHWMRVRSEKCEGRPLPAYKVAQVPIKLMSGGGDSDTFFPDLKIFASILQAHSRGTLCFVHHKPLTSKKKKKNAQCVRVGSSDLFNG